MKSGRQGWMSVGRTEGAAGMKSGRQGRNGLGCAGTAGGWDGQRRRGVGVGADAPGPLPRRKPPRSPPRARSLSSPTPIPPSATTLRPSVPAAIRFSSLPLTPPFVPPTDIHPCRYPLFIPAANPSVRPNPDIHPCRYPLFIPHRGEFTDVNRMWQRRGLRRNGVFTDVNKRILTERSPRGRWLQM